MKKSYFIISLFTETVQEWSWTAGVKRGLLIKAGRTEF